MSASPAGPRPWLAPSLLAADAGALLEEANAVAAAGADWLHVDVMDGHFVPNLSFGPATVAALAARQPLPLDVHLMVQSPEAWLEPFARAKATMLTFHWEASRDPLALLQRIRAAGLRAGISLQPDTPPQILQGCLHAVDLVLVMSVQPGFGGQAFLPQALQTLRALGEARHRLGLHFALQVDGGITQATAGAACAAGADALVAGSAVFSGSGDATPRQRYASRLQQLREAGQTPKG